MMHYAPAFQGKDLLRLRLDNIIRPKLRVDSDGEGLVLPPSFLSLVRDHDESKTKERYNLPLANYS